MAVLASTVLLAAGVRGARLPHLCGLLLGACGAAATAAAAVVAAARREGVHRHAAGHQVS